MGSFARVERRRVFSGNFKPPKPPGAPGIPGNAILSIVFFISSTVCTASQVQYFPVSEWASICMLFTRTCIRATSRSCGVLRKPCLEPSTLRASLPCRSRPHVSCYQAAFRLSSCSNTNIDPSAVLTIVVAGPFLYESIRSFSFTVSNFLKGYRLEYSVKNVLNVPGVGFPPISVRDFD